MRRKACLLQVLPRWKMQKSSWARRAIWRFCHLASGDPFWFGAGSSMMRHLAPGEWRTLPGVSTFSLAAGVMGWPLETTRCFGLHAAPLSRLRPALAPGVRLIVLLRDGAAVPSLMEYLVKQGWGTSTISVLESLGGPNMRRSDMRADDAVGGAFAHPVCAAIEVAGPSIAMPLASGRPDAFFDSDGTMTKQPVRALTLSIASLSAGDCHNRCWAGLRPSCPQVRGWWPMPSPWKAKRCC